MSHSFWWSFQDTCCLTFQTSTMQKPRVFAAFQTKTSQLTPKLHNHKTRKAWYLRHFCQNATKKQEQKTWENENPETSSCSRKPRKTQGFPVFLLKYLPNINDAPRAAADARASLLLLLLCHDCPPSHGDRWSAYHRSGRGRQLPRSSQDHRFLRHHQCLIQATLGSGRDARNP